MPSAQCRSRDGTCSRVCVFHAQQLEYCSQYCRSSSSGVAQKQVSTHFTQPSGSWRACSMSCTYSSPATNPAPSVPSSMGSSAARRPELHACGDEVSHWLIPLRIERR